MSNVVILGGGFIGQLVQAVLPHATILDWRPGPPAQENRSLGPQYLWEPIPVLHCNPLTVLTTIDNAEATPESIAAYKAKIGKVGDESTWAAQFKLETLGWDAQFKTPARVTYRSTVLGIDPIRKQLQVRGRDPIYYDLLISTIPLYAFEPLVRNERGPYLQSLDLRYKPIYVLTQPVLPGLSLCGSSTLVVNYISTPGVPTYRVTTRHDRTFTESLQPNGGMRLLPGKIFPHEDVPDRMALYASMDILHLGRYASWNPEELAHETYRILQGECARYSA